MRYFFGCILAGLAGAGMADVPLAIFYEDPELIVLGYFNSLP